MLGEGGAENLKEAEAGWRIKDDFY